MATIRDAGTGYKNTIFIALRPAAPNLVFPGTDLTVTVPDRDLETATESGNSDDTSDDGACLEGD